MIYFADIKYLSKYWTGMTVFTQPLAHFFKIVFDSSSHNLPKLLLNRL